MHVVAVTAAILLFMVFPSERTVHMAMLALQGIGKGNNHASAENDT